MKVLKAHTKKNQKNLKLPLIKKLWKINQVLILEDTVP